MRFRHAVVAVLITHMKKHGPLIRLLLRSGLVDSPAAAHKILYIIAGVCILLLLWLFSGGGSESYGNYEEMKEQYPELF